LFSWIPVEGRWDIEAGFGACRKENSDADEKGLFYLWDQLYYSDPTGCLLSSETHLHAHRVVVVAFVVMRGGCCKRRLYWAV
jgi:hypothetical protein